jgi:hypothetical protein
MSRPIEFWTHRVTTLRSFETGELCGQIWFGLYRFHRLVAQLTGFSSDEISLICGCGEALWADSNFLRVYYRFE